MLRYACAAFIALAMAPGALASPAYCSNKNEPGEPIDGRFMGIGYVTIMHMLAEQYCAASQTSLGDKLMPMIEKEGCGKETPIYREVLEEVEKSESADLKLLASGGNPNSKLTAEQVQDWAKQTADGFKGCSALIKWHAYFHEQDRFEK